MNSLALLLTLAAGFQGGSAARRIHPADALFFTEVPDVPGLLAAYEKAPLFQMVGDEDVRLAVQGLLESAEVDIGGAVTAALSQLGLPENVALAPLSTARDLLDQVTSTSLSLSLNGQPSDVSDALEKLTVCLLELETLQDKVTEFTKKNSGFPPGDLSELDLPEDLLRDPWGTPYQLEVDLDSLVPTITSMGADGTREGAGFEADISAGEWDAERSERLVSHLVTLLAHVEFREASQAQAGWDHVTLLAERGGWEADDGRTLELGPEQARVRTLRDPDLAGGQLWLLEIDSSLTMGYGDGSLERVLERRRAETADLDAESPIADLAAHLDETSGSTVVQGWIQLGHLIELADGIESALESRGATTTTFHPFPAQSVFRMQLRDDRFVTELASSSASSETDENNGAEGWARLRECVGGTPVPDSMWDYIPSESIGVFASSIDGASIYEEVLRTMGASHENKPRMLGELEQRYGFDLGNDIFGSLGQGVAGYLLPITGVITVPAVAVVVELEDAESFQRGIDGLLKLLDDQAGGEFSVRYKPYRKQPMWSFSFGGEGGRQMMGPISLSPSLAIVDNHLLVTMTSARAKKEIKRALAGGGERHPLLTNASAPPADASTIGYMNWPAFVDGTYEGARAALSLFGGMAGELPFDPEALPDAATFTQYYGPTVMWSRTGQDDGVKHTHLESSFGPETLLAMAGGGAAAFLGVRAKASQTHEQVLHAVETHGEVPIAQEHEGGRQIEVEVTEIRADPRLTKATSTSLNELATRLEVYRIESGRYPTSLATLLDPTPSYPKGFLPEGVVPVDAWGRDFVYAPTEEGSSFRLWSPGANGVDDRGALDDVVLQ